MTRKTNKVLSATLAAFVLLACAQTAAYATDIENISEETTSIETVLDTESLEATETEAIEEDTEVPEIETGVWNDTCIYEWNPNTKTLTINGTGSTKNHLPLYKDEAEHIIVNVDTAAEDFEGYAVKTAELNCLIAYANCFRDCVNLETVILGSNCQSINEGAFYNCPALKDLYINGPVCSIDLAHYVPGTIDGTTIHCYANTEVHERVSYVGYNIELN